MAAAEPRYMPARRAVQAVREEAVCDVLCEYMHAMKHYASHPSEHLPLQTLLYLAVAVRNQSDTRLCPT